MGFTGFLCCKISELQKGHLSHQEIEYLTLVLGNSSPMTCRCGSTMLGPGYQFRRTAPLHLVLLSHTPSSEAFFQCKGSLSCSHTHTLWTEEHDCLVSMLSTVSSPWSPVTRWEEQAIAKPTLFWHTEILKGTRCWEWTGLSLCFKNSRKITNSEDHHMAGAQTFQHAYCTGYLGILLWSMPPLGTWAHTVLGVQKGLLQLKPGHWLGHTWQGRDCEVLDGEWLS